MEFLEHLEGLIASKIALARDFLSLIKMETKLAGLTIYPLLINLAFLIGLFITLSLVSLLFIGYLLMILTGQPLIAFAVLLFLNTIMLIFVTRTVLRYLHQMSFAKTRHCLATNQVRDDDDYKERTFDLNCRDGSEDSQRTK